MHIKCTLKEFKCQLHCEYSKLWTTIIRVYIINSLGKYSFVGYWLVLDRKVDFCIFIVIQEIDYELY